MIEGRVFAGSWSDHFAAWQPTWRPHTLLLRYEKITAHPEEAVAQLGDFLQLRPLAGRIPEFEELRQLTLMGQSATRTAHCDLGHSTENV